MTHTVTVRNLQIGSGRPKICVPIAEQKEEEIVRFAARLADTHADMAEWRIDCFDAVLDGAALKQTMRQLRAALGELPLLVTFRTKQEGGCRAISPAEYAGSNKEILSWGFADLIDIELSMGDETVSELVSAAERAGVRTVISSHDFQKTPPREELIRRLTKMKESGADLPKLAVMPQNADDVLTLLSATESAAKKGIAPIITMALGGLGLASRLAGEVFGSALTFGSAGRASAPGQIDAEDLYRILELQHKVL